MMLTHDCGHKHPRAAFNLTILIMFIEGRPSLFDVHVLMHKAHTNGRIYGALQDGHTQIGWVMLGLCWAYVESVATT